MSALALHFAVVSALLGRHVVQVRVATLLHGRQVLRAVVVLGAVAGVLNAPGQKAGAELQHGHWKIQHVDSGGVGEELWAGECVCVYVCVWGE